MLISQALNSKLMIIVLVYLNYLICAYLQIFEGRNLRVNVADNKRNSGRGRGGRGGYQRGGGGGGYGGGKSRKIILKSYRSTAAFFVSCFPVVDIALVSFICDKTALSKLLRSHTPVRDYSAL